MEWKHLKNDNCLASLFVAICVCRKSAIGSIIKRAKTQEPTDDQYGCGCRQRKRVPQPPSIQPSYSLLESLATLTFVKLWRLDLGDVTAGVSQAAPFAQSYTVKSYQPSCLLEMLRGKRRVDNNKSNTVNKQALFECPKTPNNSCNYVFV